MYRTITRFRDQNRQLITESGPWHSSRAEAEQWAETLRELGYYVAIESQSGSVASGGLGGGNSNSDAGSNSDLAQALASMA